MNGPSCMYAIQPAFPASCQKIEYPKCMYSMKNVLDVDVAVSEGSCQNSCIRLQVGEMSILEQKSFPGMKELEIRQEVILEQLAQLKLQVASLRANLSQPSSNLKNVQNVGSVANNGNTSFKVNLIHRDLVINVSPENPPYSILALCQLWKNSMKIQVSWHTHSNVAKISDAAKSFMTSNWNSNLNENLPLLKISIVWKNVGLDAELLVTPMSRIAIKGEVNILRFLSRQGPAIFNNKTDNSPSYITATDEILDICHSLLWNHTVKDRQALLRLLNGKLRKSQFLLGDTLTIGDIAAWSVIKQIGARQDITVNMSKWLDRCSELCCEK